MARDNRLFSLALVILIGIVLQVVLIQVDNRETPAKLAIEFSKAYYKLDPSMSEYLCKGLTEENESLVNDYINRVTDEAIELGFNKNYMRYVLYGAHAELVGSDESSAKVKLTAHKKRYINPIYTFIGSLFVIGETYDVDETLNLVKEDGKWKVCGSVLELSR